MIKWLAIGIMLAIAGFGIGSWIAHATSKYAIGCCQ